MPLKYNLQIELLDVWGINFMAQSCIHLWKCFCK
jgi:hypothetical protein